MMVMMMMVMLCSHAGYLEEDPEAFDQKFLDFFNRTDLDGWLVRKGMADLQGSDVIPEPKIIAAALRACRRINDYALAVRFLEAVKLKCGPKKMVDAIYPWLIQEVRPPPLLPLQLGLCEVERKSAGAAGAGRAGDLDARGDGLRPAGALPPLHRLLGAPLLQGVRIREQARSLQLLAPSQTPPTFLGPICPLIWLK